MRGRRFGMGFYEDMGDASEGGSLDPGALAIMTGDNSDLIPDLARMDAPAGATATGMPAIYGGTGAWTADHKDADGVWVDANNRRFDGTPAISGVSTSGKTTEPGMADAIFGFAGKAFGAVADTVSKVAPTALTKAAPKVFRPIFGTTAPAPRREPPPSGPSTTTVIVVGALVLGGLYVVTKGGRSSSSTTTNPRKGKKGKKRNTKAKSRKGKKRNSSKAKGGKRAKKAKKR